MIKKTLILSILAFQIDPVLAEPKEVIEIICTEFNDEGVESGTLWRVLQSSTAGDDNGVEVSMDGRDIAYSDEFAWENSPKFPAVLTSFSGTLNGPRPDPEKLKQIFENSPPKDLVNLQNQKVKSIKGFIYRHLQKEFSFYVGSPLQDRIVLHTNGAIPSEPWGYFGSVRRYNGNEISDPIFGGILNCLEARTIPGKD